MIDQLIIGERASFDEFFASVAKRKLGEAKKKSIKETVPFSNVTYDFSKINGELYWEERELEYTFEIIAPTPEKLEELKSKFAGWVKNVHQEELHDPFIPEHHFLATYDDMDWEDEEGLDKTTATVKFTAYPYKISNQPVVFEGSASGTHSASLMVNNESAHPVAPTVLVEASSQMSAFVVIDGVSTTCSLDTGKAVQLPVRLPVGASTVTVIIPSYYAGFTVKVSFHEEVF
jgi:anaerobic selenocysteine-containing dehydrogenase